MLKLHYFLFGLQTLGAVILFWNGVPLYRQILADPAAHEPRAETWLWALASIALIQAGYWISYQRRLPMPQFSSALLGHAMQFLSRLTFVFVAAVFGFTFIVRKNGFELPASRYVLLILLLFSLYCYNRELGRWGQAFEARKPAAGRDDLVVMDPTSSYSDKMTETPLEPSLAGHISTQNLEGKRHR